MRLNATAANLVLPSMLPPNRFVDRKTATATAVVLAIAGLVFLALSTSRQAFSDTDVQIAQWVGSLDFFGLDTIMGLVNILTGAEAAIGAWVVAIAFFVLRGRPLEAIAVFLIGGIWMANQALNWTVGSTFPSGHMTHAVTFYGLLALLALKNLDRGYLKYGVPMLAVVIIGLTSVGRVYAEAHWPRDVLGSCILGFIGLVAILWFYSQVKDARFHLPRLRKKRPAPEHHDGVNTANSVASTVYLDAQAGTAIKEYHPPRPVRAIYWLAFQAPFPYQHRRDALEAAAAKRKIAGLLTEHRLGYDMVAPVLEIRSTGESHQFITEFVPGVSPRCNAEVEDTLSELTTYFHEVGLPTWQVLPGNPHAYSNLIRDPHGALKVIDLESALISVPSWRELRSLIRDGSLPVFDDVDFVRLHNYLQSHASELTRSLGAHKVGELRQAVRAAELATQTWKESEPRIWGRFARWLYRHLDLTRLIHGIQGCRDGSEVRARAFTMSAIERWERDGLVDRERAAALQGALSTREVRRIMTHMGVHIALSAAIAVPIPGLRSLARFVWTLAFRLKALYDLSRGRITREECYVEGSIHSVPVMLLSLVPGLGAVSYVAGGTLIRSGLARVLVDQAVYKLPLGLYGRLHLARLTAPRSPQMAAEHVVAESRVSGPVGELAPVHSAD